MARLGFASTLVTLALLCGLACALLEKKLSTPFTDDPHVQQLGNAFSFYDANLLTTSSNLTGNVRRQQLECEPGYLPCPGGVYCTQIGYFCCEEDESHGCPTGESCCVEQGGCAKAGSYCCADGSGTCPQGSSCCAGERTCARTGETCCGNGVCAAGKSCCPGGQSCAEKGGTCCGEGACDAGQTCCGSGSGCADEGWTCCGQEYQCPPESKCCKDEDGDYFCAEECVPSLIFPYVEGLLDEIYENMCRGVLRSSTTADPNSAIVTLESKTGRALRRAKAQRRRDAGCTGSQKIVCPPGTNCDEFPFASSVEGGSGATIMCVPSWQNNWQGTYYSSWLSEVLGNGKLTRGGQFRVVLKNIDCSKYLRKRLAKRAGDNGVLQQNGNVTLLSQSLFGNYSKNNALFIDLTEDETTPGRYSINYNLSKGSLLSGAIIDDDGEYLTTIDALSSGGSSSASVDLEEDYGDITFLGWTKDEDVQVSYQLSVTPASTSSASDMPTDTSTDISSPATTTPAPSVSMSVAGSKAAPLWGAASLSGLLWLFL